MEKHQLSKSTFIRGVQCAKSLYLHKHRPFLRDKLSAEQLAKFNRGHQIGHLAQQLFPGGVDCSPKHPSQYAKALEMTKECIEKGETIIYEAVFQHHGVLVMLDILVKTNAGWQAFEVKSSLKISDTYVMDAALQYFVVLGSGLSLDKQYLITLNPGYVRSENLDLEQLFLKTDITTQCIEKQGFVREQIEEELRVLALKSSPNVAIGKHCHEPYPCDFLGHCWKQITPDSVLYMLSPTIETRFAWHHAGMLKPDIQDTGLGAWTSEVQSLTSGKPFVIKSDLAAFFESVQSPTLFLEATIERPALPPYTASTAYEPLIRTLAYTELGAATVQAHFVNLTDDQRIVAFEFLRELSESYQTIVVWQADELLAALDGISIHFAETARSIENIKHKIIDLSAIVQSESVFFPIPNAGKDLVKIGAGLGISEAINGLRQLSLAAIARKHAAINNGAMTPDWEADIQSFLKLNVLVLKELFLILKTYLA